MAKFVKNRDAITKAWKDVCDASSDIKWAIFGYEGKTDEVKVVETGDGDLEEMAEELSSSKVQYAFCQVVDPNTNLFKLVLINWIGEACPEARKGLCSRHFPDVARILRGAHVTINARSEDDVEESFILDKVSKSSGSNYSFHKEKAVPLEEPKPVSSVYKRTMAAAEIKGKNRDEFWDKLEQEQKSSQVQERQMREEEARAVEQERRQREEQEAIKRERELQEKSRIISEKERQLEAEAEERAAADRARFEKSEADVDTSSSRPVPSSQRTQEAKQLLAQRSANPRDQFEPQWGSEEPPSPPRKQPIQLPRAPEPEPEQEPPQQEEELYDETDLQEPEPEQPPANEWGEPEEPEVDDQPFYDETETQEQPLYDETDLQPPPQQQQEPEEELYEEAEVPQSPPAPGGGGGGGLRAQALYDYQAEDETEITFDPGDIIEDIEQIDEGWWRGTSPDGTYGLFPANYVELIE
ncbi:drebrin-like protein B [Apostichopus japonicus]|uniref:drebrin-like protein B n=1 Tax=Stichopus japonicus TaxID=307972 RepID=UPI003AB4C6E8